MRRHWFLIFCAMVTTAPCMAAPVNLEVGTWQPPAGLQQMPIWPAAAPNTGPEPLPQEKLQIASTPEAIGSDVSVGVYDVTVPTISVFPPKGENTGASMIVMPGGGFQMLAITIEGTEICDWLTSKGITCILLKYRVPNTAHHYDKNCHCHLTPKIPRALQDAQRAIRLVRSKAEALHIDPNKIGVIGFSAGGYLAAQTSNIFTPAYKPVDAIDTISSRPDFAVVVYPGHLCRSGATLDPGIHVTKQTSPTFLLQAWDDPVDEICNSTVYARALDAAGVPAEVHLFGEGGHAFGLRHSKLSAVWPTLVESWLSNMGVINH